MIEDQTDRQLWASAGSNDSKIRDKVAYRDSRRTTRLVELLKVVRSPSAAMIGLDGSRAIWLLAQHSNVGVMMLVLQKFRYLYNKNKRNVFYQGIPYLYDRTRIIKGQKQRYGTQFFIDKEGCEHQFPVSSPEGLAKRKAAFGLCIKGDCAHVSSSR